MPGKVKTTRKKAQRAGETVNFGELTGSTGFLLRRAELATFGNLIATLKPLDLTPIQFSVLVLIEANPDLAQTDLCFALGVQKGNFVQMLDALESRGLTERRVSRLDRRIKTLALTPAGVRLFARAVTLHAKHEGRLLQYLQSNGKDQLTLLLNRLLAAGRQSKPLKRGTPGRGSG